MGALGEKSFFWDKPEGALTADELAYYQYSAQNMASVYETMYTTGIAPLMAVTSETDNPEQYIGSSLFVVSGDGLKVIVSQGVAMIKGRPYIASLPVEFSLNSGVTTDILLQMDIQSPRPEIKLIAKERATNETLVNNITHDPLLYEIAVATVAVPAGSIQVSPAMITDQRLNTTLHPVDNQPISGLMRSIPKVDTLGIWDDWQELRRSINATWAAFINANQDEWRQFIAAHTKEFDDWFKGLQAALDENVAANLYNLINEKLTLVVSETDIPVAERKTNTLYFFVRETQSGGGGLPESITVSPNMALKPVQGVSKSGIDFN